MVIGRAEDRESPSGSKAIRAATMFGTRSAEPIWASGPMRPHQQAGHMTASVRSQIIASTTCKQGAVHIWTTARAASQLGRGDKNFQLERQLHARRQVEPAGDRKSVV